MRRLMIFEYQSVTSDGAREKALHGGLPLSAQLSVGPRSGELKEESNET